MLGNRSCFDQEPSLEAHSLSTTEDTQGVSKNDELTGNLIAAWPAQRYIDLICTLPVGLSAHLHRAICQPYASMGKEPLLPQKMLQLPQSGSHPVLFARTLLVLGTFIQGILPSSIQSLGEMGVTCREIMSRVVDIAIRLVTTNDDLVCSVEGLECIMIEAQYHNYAGNLHKAWMAVRRATAVAQLMALHRGLKSPSLKILDAETRKNFNLDHMCFRLVEMDRYLSLMLGLPPTSLEARFTTPKALENCSSIDRMQRLHCAVAGRILQRSDADLDDFSKTDEIEILLRTATADLPPQWWLVPKFESINKDEIIHDVVHLMDQISHYHLLLRLHLPYLMRVSENRRYDQSRIIAVNVSREILFCYLAFRTSNPGHFYCRGTDFLALVAIIVLSFVHIESQKRCNRPDKQLESGAPFDFLAHSRPSDRDAMERTLNIIETMAREGPDPIASRIARIIRHLLAIEVNAANGTAYRTSSSKSDEGEFDGKMIGAEATLHVYVPHFGAINFQRGVISSSPSKTSSQLKEDVLISSANEATAPCRLFIPNQQLQPPISGSPPQESIASTDAWSFNNIYTQSALSIVPVDGSNEEEDWGLQSVDLALFNTLFGGTENLANTEDETWIQWADPE